MSRKSSLKRTLSAVLAQGLVGAWVLAGAIALAPSASAQDHGYEMIPAPPQPPPGMEDPAAEQRKAPAQPPRPASIDELLEQVRKQPGGRDKVDKARSGKAGEKISGSDRQTPPPGLEDPEKQQKEAPAKPPRPPSVDELLEQIRKQPGGQGKVDAAKKARGKKGGAGGALAWLSRLNPFHTETAYAQSSFSQQLNVGNHWRSTDSFAVFHSPRVYPWSKGSPYVPMYQWLNTTFDHQLTNPYITTGAQIPTLGWYIINVQCDGILADMSVWILTGTGWQKEADLPSGSNNNYPVLFYLGAGNQYLTFVVTSGSCYVSEVSWQGV